MGNINFDSATFFYKVFLLVLICTQIHLLFFHGADLHIIGEAGTIILLIYLIFRFYLLNRLGNKAKYLSLTLAEFLAQREIYDAKCKAQRDAKR